MRTLQSYMRVVLAMRILINMFWFKCSAWESSPPRTAGFHACRGAP